MKMGFIGLGKMGEAMISGLLRSGVVRGGDVTGADVSEDRQREMRKEYGIRVCGDNGSAVAVADVVVLAVKPQELEAVLRETARRWPRRSLAVSIAAGKKTRWIESLLPGRRVIRVMPNLACTVGAGVSVYCRGRRATEKDARTAERILSCFGRVLSLPERHFDTVTALSGSGPAFLAYVAYRMALGAAAAGLPQAEALFLTVQTMLGTARMLEERFSDPKELIRAVASPKGTTAAGLAVLERSDVGRVLARTLKAAARRSRELSGGK